MDNLWNLDQKEFQYIAADYLQAMSKHLMPKNLPLLKNLIINKSWWDSVDALVKRVGDITLKYPQCKTVILEWARDENIWLVRTAIIHQLAP